jgi:hypothetical protein
MILSVIIIAFLLFMIGNHVFRKLNLEGFEVAPEVKPEVKAADPTVSEVKPEVKPEVKTEVKPEVKTEVKAPDPTVSVPNAPDPKAAVPTVAQQDTSETDKSTIMTDLFESVNKQMDIIRTLKLSENMIPIKIDKTVLESQLILANLKLLVNNGVYKNELDLKEIYDKYIGNKAVQLLASDINSLNLESPDSQMETTFLTRTKSVVDGHQKIIDKILENKSKE